MQSKMLSQTTEFHWLAPYQWNHNDIFYLVCSNNLELPEIRRIAYYSYHITDTTLMFCCLCSKHTQSKCTAFATSSTAHSYATASEVIKTFSMLLLSTIILLNLNLLLWRSSDKPKLQILIMFLISSKV